MNTYQISEYRINISVPFLYTNSKHTEKQKISPFKIPPKGKISLINLTIESKDSYNENLNRLKEAIEDVRQWKCFSRL